MPRVNANYNNTIIYKIVCNDLNIKDIYVGHTTNFTKRKSHHKISCCNPNDKDHNIKVYKTIRENKGWDNWNMIEIEKYPCNDANEARSRERYWLENLSASLNMMCPNRTQKEYKEAHKDLIKDWKHKHYELNKETIREKQKQYVHLNQDTIKLYKQKYAQLNKTRLNEHRKEYNILNKEKVDNYRYAQINCECGGTYQRCNKSQHIRTNLHKNYLSSLELY